MWNNFFRTIYALYGGWCGMLSHNLLYPEKYKIALVEKRHHAPKDYLYILKKAAPSGVLYYQDIEDGIYKAVFVGIPRSCLFGEIHHENESYRDLARNVAMNQLRSWFLAKFKVSQVEKPSLITFIVRNEPIRNILNVDQVADVLASFGEVKVVDFANLSLYQQLQIILKTKILITLHGAALTHSFFLPKDSCVIEIFPFQFRKYIYQNICRIIGIKYMPFENKKIENTVFNWDYVERHRFTSRSKEEIVSKPVDWFNMDSKNYYRNQDTLVDLNELKNIMNMAQQTIPYKFMLYLPWEQLNNQVIGFKVGCAIANFTSRVLVLPRIGYRKEFNEERKIFEVMDFEWREFDKYFVVEEGCPCKTVSFEVFQALNRGKEIENVYFRGIGNSVNFSYMQIIDYYKHVIGLGFKNIKRLPLGDKDVHLTRQEIIQKFKEIPNDRVLALGSLFWLYGFEQNPEYPLTRYYDYLEDPLYKQISETLAFQSNYEEMFKKAQLEVLGQTYGAIHIRRGDYRDKCKEVLHNSTLYMSCYQSLDAILQVIERKDPSIKWYIATNDFNEREIRAFLDRKGIETVNFHDIKEHLPLSLDPIEVSIIDQLICINSIHFHGNFYSSFSRTIAEKRALVNKKAVGMKKLSAREKQLEYWKSIHSKSKSKAVEQSIPTTPLKDSTNTPKSTAKYVTQKKQTTTMATTPVQEAQEEKATQKQSSTPSMVFSDFEELKEFLADKLQRLSHFQEEIGKGQLVDIYCADAADLLKEVFEGVCVKCDVIEEKMQAFQAMTQRNEELELALTLTMRENELLHSAVVNLSELEKE